MIEACASLRENFDVALSCSHALPQGTAKDRAAANPSGDVVERSIPWRRVSLSDRHACRFQWLSEWRAPSTARPSGCPALLGEPPVPGATAVAGTMASRAPRPKSAAGQARSVKAGQRWLAALVGTVRKLWRHEHCLVRFSLLAELDRVGGHRIASLARGALPLGGARQGGGCLLPCSAGGAIDIVS